MTELTILNCFSVMLRYLNASCLMNLVMAPGPRNVSILKTKKKPKSKQNILWKEEPESFPFLFPCPQSEAFFYFA